MQILPVNFSHPAKMDILIRKDTDYYIVSSELGNDVVRTDSDNVSEIISKYLEQFIQKELNRSF
jgi:hypothetical protein